MTAPMTEEAIARVEALARKLEIKGSRRYSEIPHKIEGKRANAAAKKAAAEAEDLRALLSLARQGLEMREALSDVLALPVAVAELVYLDRGIGTKTQNAAWLKARAALQQGAGR